MSIERCQFRLLGSGQQWLSIQSLQHAFFTYVLMEEMCLSASRHKEKESKEKAEVDRMQKMSDPGQHKGQACLGSIQIRED